jgi:plastocyanin
MPSKRSLWAFAALALAMGAASAHAETITVTVDKMAFSPAEINAKVGDTIEWVNKDAFVHTATVKGGWEVMLPVKKSGSIVVNTAGSIDYYCRLHPNMKGRVVVTAP